MRLHAGRKARCFRSTHIVPTLGWCVLETRRKLKSELAGAPREAILRAKEAGERIHDDRLDALPVLAAYGPSPAPPVVLVGGDAALADELRAALIALHEDADGRAALERGRMLRLDPVADADYDLTRDCDRRAAPWTP